MSVRPGPGGLQPVPTLLQISHPSSPHMVALRQFRHRTLVALTQHDLSVPYASAAVRRCVWWLACMWLLGSPKYVDAQ